MVSLCLNMIVKNESKIIRRLLNSVINVIDSYCICDTGSTDNTVEIIENYFNDKKIPGKVVKEPFKNFEYNRSFALKCCDEIEADYILLLDADMIFTLDIEPEKFKSVLQTNDCFFIFQGSDTMYYKNTRVVKNRSGFSYKGVTHEYVELPPNAKQGIFSKDHVFINDIGDGGAKSDKFSRDVKLLKEGLKEHPDNERYTFYLANSLKDLASTERHSVLTISDNMINTNKELTESLKSYPQICGITKQIEILCRNVQKEINENAYKLTQESIQTYKKRIEMGGFWEEVWYSYYNIGNLYVLLMDIEKAIYYYYQGYIVHPERVENLYKIVNHYREKGDNVQAQYYYNLAKNSMIKYPSRDYLFIEKDIYDYKLDYEMSIIGFYHNPNNFDMCKLSMDIISQKNIEDHLARSVYENYKFYSESLKNYDTKILQKNDFNSALQLIGKMSNIPEGFNTSTPTFCFVSEHEICANVRFVDYYINEHGGYEQMDKITTINVAAHMKRDNETGKWHVEKEKILEYDTKYDDLYVGLEDIRIFNHDASNKLYYTCNRGIGHGNMKVEYGILNMNNMKCEKSVLLKKINQNSVEKNWVMFNNVNDTSCPYMIYNWSPLEIGKIETDKFVTTKKIKTPYLFKSLRGSTNGVEIDNELWFLCHLVSYEGRRHYYHIMVILDKNTLELKNYSYMFTFEKEKVEYCLGMTHENDNINFGISIMDKTTKTMSIKKQWFDDHLVL